MLKIKQTNEYKQIKDLYIKDGNGYKQIASIRKKDGSGYSTAFYYMPFILGSSKLGEAVL